MNLEVVAGLLNTTVEEIERIRQQGAADEEDRGELREKASRYDNLVHAMGQLDPKWSDPKVCMARQRELFLEASLLMDGVERCVAEMIDIDDLAQDASMIAHLGDEDAAFSGLTPYGSDLLNKILQRGDSLEAIYPTRLAEDLSNAE